MFDKKHGKVCHLVNGNHQYEILVSSWSTLFVKILGIEKLQMTCVCNPVWRRETSLSPPVTYFLLTVQRWYFFCGSSGLFMSYVGHAFVSVHCCLVVTCWERADL